jgi:hypothetical protein
LHFDEATLNIKNLSAFFSSGIISEEFQICQPTSIQHSLYAISPLNVSSIYYSHHHQHYSEASHVNDSGILGGYRFTPFHNTAITHIYYTEADQILRFEDDEALEATLAASNATTYFLGRRKEKWTASDPREYMNSLSKGRECGRVGEEYLLNWPTSNQIQKVK